MSNRTYSAVPSDFKGTAGFSYIFDPALVLTTGVPLPITGNWRPYSTADISTSNVSVSGLSLTVGAVNVTGIVPITVAGGSITVVNPVVPVSGVVEIPFTKPVFVTGSFASQTPGTTLLTGNSLVGITGGNINVTLTGTPSLMGPVPISGVVQAQVTLGNLAITGFNSTIQPLAISGVVQASVSTVDTGNRSVLVTNPIAVTGGSIIGIDTGVRATNIVSTIPFSITGGISGSNIGSLDLNRSYLAVSGLNFNTSVTVNSVGITGFVNVTGQVSIASASLELALLSGIYSGVLGTSGQLAANLAGSAPISGDIRNIPGTVLAISGFVNTIVTGTVAASVPNPLGITGTTRDLNPRYSGINSYPALWVAGRAVTPSGIGSVTGYNTGDAVLLSMDSTNGSVFVTQGVLDKNVDTIQTFIASSGIVLNSGVSGLAPAFFGTALGNNPSRKAWFINNLGTGGLMVNFSTNMPTTGVLNLFLKGASTPWAGDGASFSDSPAVWSGPVSVSGFGGSPCVYNAWQI